MTIDKKTTDKIFKAIEKVKKKGLSKNAKIFAIDTINKKPKEETK